VGGGFILLLLFADRYKTGMLYALIFLCLAVCSAKSDVLFQDERKGHRYRFESDQKHVEMKVTRQEVIELALFWAMNFYRDRSLEVASLKFEIEPCDSGWSRLGGQ
jgi:hypothetical protein